MQEKITFFYNSIPYFSYAFKISYPYGTIIFQIHCKGTATLINTTGKSPESYFLDQKEP